MIRTLLFVSALTFAPVEQPTVVPTEEPTTTETITTTTETTTTETTLVEDIKKFADDYLNLNTILGIVNGLVSSGAIFTALGVYISKRKQKVDIESSVIASINSVLGTSFKSFKDEELKEFITKQQITQDMLALMIKALVLAQDKTAEGKKALVDLMLECNAKLGTVDTKTEQILTNAKEEIVKEQTKIEQANKKVENDYTPID